MDFLSAIVGPVVESLLVPVKKHLGFLFSSARVPDWLEEAERIKKDEYPLLPSSLQCSSKLQTLCLHQCSLMFDCSPIGNHLLSLEVLSFARSGIRYLPPAIGNLVKLKLLDLTGCMDLHIDEGVLRKLVKLEDLYMTVAKRKGIKFTDTNYKELAERSKDLSALEVEFFQNNPQSKNMSYNKLERFKISMGRFLEENWGQDMRSSKNTLMFDVANKDELLESGLNELFSKTEVLHLKAGGMNNLEEVLPKSVPRHSPFYGLRALCVSGCADLRYLFTVRVASGLVKLERLTVSECPVMAALVYSENGEEGVDIRFQELKYLDLFDLPMLVGLSNTNNVIHLPQLVKLYLRKLPNFTSIYPGEYKSTSIMSSGSSTIKPFFNKKVMIPPRLEELSIWDMEALENIWGPSDEEVDDATCSSSLLREISVGWCDNVVKMFPRNPMPLLLHLESIWVGNCDSMEVLFEIDDDDVGSCIGGEIKQQQQQGSSSFSKLRDIQVWDSENLREVWRLKGGGVNTNHEDDLIICGFFQAVEVIRIGGCKRFRNIFTPTTARFHLTALTTVYIQGAADDSKKSEEEEENKERKQEEEEEKIQLVKI